MKSLEDQPQPTEVARAWMSALADGRAEACEPAVSAWASSDDARKTWHAYQVIGDVLRSEDLATPAARDEAFLQSLRLRLAQEPTVLAPEPLRQPIQSAAPHAGRHSRIGLRWGAAAAVAGVFMVGGVALTLQRVGGQPQLASSGATGAPVASAVSTAPDRLVSGQTGVPVSLPVNGSAALVEPETQQWRLLNERVLRDARLEDYLRAHRGSRAVGGRLEPVVLER
jgi:sigma-E factor negative regulatory protein RseA